MNGQTAATIMHTDDYTGYVSPYFVISKGKFTKHYFEGAGRIVSKLGNGAFAQPLGITAGGVNYTNLTAEQQKAVDNYVRSLGVPPGPASQQGIYATPEFTGDPYPSAALKPVEENQEPPEGWPRNPTWNKDGDVPGPPVQFGPPVKPETVKAGEGFTGIGLPENDIFYFHPDHLGSTSYISTKNGSVSQHVEYIAFGEVLFEEHSSSFSSPYLFNGKELDRETNLSYYGARYLDMKTSLWLSLDKEGENDLSVGGYVYSFNNPINFTDPDGNWPDLPSWGNSLINRAKTIARNYINKKVDNIVSNTRNYVKQKSKAILNAITPSNPLRKSKPEKAQKASGFGISFTTEGGKEGGMKTPQGGRDVKQVDMSVIIGLTDVYGPETTIPGVAPDGSNPFTNGGNSSPVPTSTTSADNNENIESTVELKYRETTGKGSRYGNVILPDFNVKDTVVPESKASSIYNKLDKKFQNDWQKQVKKDN